VVQFIRQVESTMKATEFEYRHQTLVHQFIVAVAFLTYFIERDDVVWRFVKDSVTPRELERAFFLIATILIAVGAVICTWARAHDSSGGLYRYFRYSRYLGELLYAIELGSLAPLTGFVILVAGESLRLSRLVLRESGQQRSSLTHNSMWLRAFLQEATKWGIFLTMIVFVITLKDRVAEVLAVVSFLVGWLARLFCSIQFSESGRTLNVIE